MISFRESVSMGAQMLELDVRLTKDGVPFVCHDATIKRVSGKSGSVADRTAKSLLSLDLGNGFRFATLEEALSELTPRIPVNVEMKFERPDYRALATAVCDVIRNLGVERRILISSFFHPSLEIVSKLNPAISVAPLFGSLTGLPHEDDLEVVFSRGRRGDVPDVYPFEGPAAVVSHKMIDSALAERFSQAKATLLTYTVDEPAEMKRLIHLGIDGIITNRPAVLQKVLAELF